MTDKIRLLIVDDIPETRAHLQRLLYFEDDIEVVGAAASGEQGIEMAKQLQPDIVLMDINMPGIDGIRASEQILQTVPPGIQVVMMSVQAEADYLRRSMLAGAREFVIKPFSIDDLLESLRRVYARRVATPAPVTPAPAIEIEHGQIISVYSPNGGLGCTTLATNLAIALQAVSKSQVALVDASLQFGHVAVMLNLQATSSIADLNSPVDAIDADLLNEVLCPHPTGIRVLPAPPEPEMADTITVEQIETILTKLIEAYDFVIVDTASVLNDMTLNILDLSNLILLVMEAEIPILSSVHLFMKAAKKMGYPSQKISLVLNRADRHTGIKVQDIEAKLKQAILARIPQDERLATMAANMGKPIVMAQRRSPFARSIVELARVLTRRLDRRKVESVKERVVREEYGHEVFKRIPGS